MGPNRGVRVVEISVFNRDLYINSVSTRGRLDSLNSEVGARMRIIGKQEN